MVIIIRCLFKLRRNYQEGKFGTNVMLQTERTYGVLTMHFVVFVIPTTKRKG